MAPSCVVPLRAPSLLTARASHLAPSFPRSPAQPGNKSLAEHDPEMFDLIEKEKARQTRSLELIASEVRCHRWEGTWEVSGGKGHSAGRFGGE
jgi:hypothetical protein